MWHTNFTDVANSILRGTMPHKITCWENERRAKFYEWRIVYILLGYAKKFGLNFKKRITKAHA